jgi:tRNA uridine 5-carboxymethylaminomethyl modification enzyme
VGRLFVRHAYDPLVRASYRVIVIGGGHAGVEAAWAAANLIGEAGAVALVTLNPGTIGVMSCNPAIGGLAKGQLAREVDALNGIMGLAADASGIMFKVLNTSRGPAVRGPRCQNDKEAYAEAVQGLIAGRREIDIIAGAVDDFVIDAGRIVGVRVSPPQTKKPLSASSICAAAAQEAGRTEAFEVPAEPIELRAPAVVLTTGTFMRGLMHTGNDKTPGGRHGEAPAVGISATLSSLGFELGRLKTGTPPRLDIRSLDWDNLPEQHGDADPVPFSDLTDRARFPAIEQVSCRQTHTTPFIHDLIRANLHRAPIFSGQVEGTGPRYCPSIEDKVDRFDRDQHGVFLEPESHRLNSVYCNGISSSLPRDVQARVVRAMPGCEHAEILRFGYAVEYDSVLPHQILATGMTKRIEGLFLAGQINGTSGYEEAAAQGVVAGVNAVRYAEGQSEWVLGRDQAYIGVLMDDLVTKTPVEPYRMFTSRAEHRLLLRADNAADRLTPIADELGLLTGDRGTTRRGIFVERANAIGELQRLVDETKLEGEPLSRWLKRPEFTEADFARAVGEGFPAGVRRTAFAERKYADYVVRQHNQIRRQREMERKPMPSMDFGSVKGLRAEAALALTKFAPATFGQAGRLEGVTPADLSLIAVHAKRRSESASASSVDEGSAA